MCLKTGNDLRWGWKADRKFGKFGSKHEASFRRDFERDAVAESQLLGIIVERIHCVYKEKVIRKEATVQQRSEMSKRESVQVSGENMLFDLICG